MGALGKPVYTHIEGGSWRAYGILCHVPISLDDTAEFGVVTYGIACFVLEFLHCMLELHTLRYPFWGHSGGGSGVVPEQPVAAPERITLPLALITDSHLSGGVQEVLRLGLRSDPIWGVLEHTF